MKVNFLKKILSGSMVVALTGGLLVSQFSMAKPAMVSAAAAPKLTFGVISDFQLMDNSDNELANIKKSLTKFKENNIKVLMVAGDISNGGRAVDYVKFNKIFDEVFTDPATAPEKVLVMGNHDYWNGMTPKEAQKNFTETLGVPLNTHVVADGYHFIGVSTEEGYVHGVFPDTSKNWLKKQLDEAKADDPNKPIFVTFHQHIKNTVYLSDEWGNEALDEVLKNYPQAITFSGHSHAVLEDERSIHQREYTNVGTSTLSYTELESGKDNGTVPPGAFEVAQGIIGTISDTAVTLERYDFHNDCKIKTDWVVDLPVNKANFKYTDARIAASVAPYFAEDSKATVSDIQKAGFKLTFDQAKDEDLVQSYRIEVYDPKTQTNKRDFLIFSDFYLGLPRMAPKLSYGIKGLDANTSYDVRVYGIDSFGKQSAPITTKVTTLATINLPETDVLNVNFADKTGKDSSTYNTAFELKNNAKIQLDSALNKQVLALDGSSYVNYNMSDTQLGMLSNGFTLETVFKMNTLKNQAIIESCESNNGVGSGLGFESTGAGKVELWACIGGSYKKVGVQLEAGKYYYLVATYDGSKINLYLDGKLVESLNNVTGAFSYTSGIAMCLGGDPSTQGNANLLLDGSIAYVRMINKGISAQAVQNHYNEFYGIKPPTTTTTSTTGDSTHTTTTVSTVHTDADTTTISTTGTTGSSPITGANASGAAAIFAVLSAVCVGMVCKSKSKKATG